jgi:hypothetical protein
MTLGNMIIPPSPFGFSDRAKPKGPQRRSKPWRVEHGAAASRRDRHRESQRRYEARQRDGIGLYPVPLTGRDIDVLIYLTICAKGQKVIASASAKQ